MSTDHLLGGSVLERGDKICYEPSTDSTDGETQDYLIYFMPGNPGLISYYQPFLSKLHSLLCTKSSSQSAQFHICGHSFRGFELGQYGASSRSPIGLEDQVSFQEQLLYRHIDSHRRRFGNTPRVILMGHSVGAYVLLELIQQHRNKVDEEGEEDFDLIGGILLFPTITYIAKSPLGMVFSVCRL